MSYDCYFKMKAEQRKSTAIPTTRRHRFPGLPELPSAKRVHEDNSDIDPEPRFSFFDTPEHLAKVYGY